MILPIVAYGNPVLREVAVEINEDYPALKTLIANMKETMYNAFGVGLAAPQIGKAIRLFLIDTSLFAEDEEASEKDRKVLENFNKIFINAKILKEEGEEWAFNEGCLSIPGVKEDIFRKPKITIEYQDENFKRHTETLNGLVARVFQHEYDHIDGVLFIDKLSTLKKRLLKKKLKDISKGKIDANYEMCFPNAKKGK